ncbi:flavodoxin family protein [Clostridium estertheticum]|uniref:FMN reductase n=1 Tax=Clostridium estertheticum subsp. estertheticum TaxID=1552 RepID=A0A1J0GCX4_9CLOT|nr:flavodoxin family protein [Clostridium estertheticum]APC39181.1 FMN reductase [Clostridium estertheticum subsp. estertheticum]MBU3171247.1 flavodoxin family protein [Clostridium estertheticum]MBZ9614830.1 flavodoxin family protein [Clostridium estertheticum subsp. laramiense]WAG74742.1 flavodoxin family protein [Clostridium estertheticum]
MKVLGISGGRKDGNNDAMCKEALMAAKEMGAEVEFVHLLDLDIKYCIGCTACVGSLMTGKGNMCVLKDDFDWLLNKMLDADGVIFTNPIFCKGTPSLFLTIRDRFGPRMDRGNNVIATKIAKATGGKAPDPRILKDKVISYIGFGGSDWVTRFQCDCAIQALTPMWKVIDNEVFPWSTGIIIDNDKVTRVHEIGMNLAKAAKDIANASYKGEKGVCPHCHSRNFYLDRESTHAICCMCGIEGDVKIIDGKVRFEFPKEQLEHAHDTLSGKLIHVEDIKNTVAISMELKKSDDYKQRSENYKEFITATKPEK